MSSRHKTKPRVKPVRWLFEVWEFHYSSLHAKWVLCTYRLRRRVNKAPPKNRSSYGHGAKGRYTGWRPQPSTQWYQVREAVSLDEKVQCDDCGFRLRGKSKDLPAPNYFSVERWRSRW